MSKRALPLARIASWLFVLAVIVLFILGAIQFCANGLGVLGSILPNSNWTVERLHAALAEIGWSPQAYSLYYLVFAIFSAFWYALVALLILWRRGDNWFGLLLAVELVAIGVMANSVFGVAQVARFIPKQLGWIFWPAFFICFYLFPDGRFVPRWTLGLTVVMAFFSVLGSFMTPAEGGGIPFWIFVPIFVGILAAPISQIYRYLRVSDPIQKQQTKVVVFGMIITALVLPFQVVINQLYGNNAIGVRALQWNLVNTFLVGGVACLLPISIGVAMLRYRLWDVDIIIRRTLTYALVTALLALVFFGSVILLQQVFSGITGAGQNEIVTVLSTLAIAALFVPVRNRIQTEIDRRFNRKKYNTQQVLTDFANTVRDETDLEKLTGRLIQVVDETMQPETVSVWLKRETKRQGTK